MFKQRKPKRFNYKLRLQQSNDEKNKNDFEAKWKQARNTTNRGKVLSSLPVLIILLIMVCVIIYILNGYIN